MRLEITYSANTLHRCYYELTYRRQIINSLIHQIVDTIGYTAGSKLYGLNPFNEVTCVMRGLGFETQEISTPSLGKRFVWYHTRNRQTRQQIGYEQHEYHRNNISERYNIF